MPIITNPSLATVMADTTPLQDIFDTCSVHLMTQARRAMAGMSCAYRGNGGTKCAVGCLIADNEYQYAMENKTAGNLLQYAGYTRPVGLDVEARDLWSDKLNLLFNLQSVHDGHAPATWLDELKQVAERMPRPLSTIVLDQFNPALQPAASAA